MFVGGVGGGRLIVLRNVGSWGRGEFIGRLRGDIVRHRRGGRLTVRGRTDVVMGGVKRGKKKMDDPSSKGVTGGVIRFLVYVSLFIFYLRAEWARTRRCHFCGVKGQIVDGFPRRE